MEYMSKINFKYSDEACVYPKLVAAMNALCAAKGKDALCTSGYRSLEKQKVINKQSASLPGRIQRPDGSVYDKAGKCWASAYGKSNHNYCIAMDISDEWFQNVTNSDLYKYGLFKPVAHELWHVQLLEHSGISQTQKEIIRDACIKGVCKDMDLKDFQVLAGLQPDGVNGPKTQVAAREALRACVKILGLDFKNAGEVIAETQNNPSMWMGYRKTIKYFDDFVMNIVKKMRGEI
jgi:hypothetical protein